MVALAKLSRLGLWRRPSKKPPLTSSAQYLPTLIIRRIAHYVAADDSVLVNPTGSAANVSDGSGIGLDADPSVSSNQDRLAKGTRAMVAVCRSWRVAVIALFYSHIVLDINSTAMWISPYRKMMYEKCDAISNHAQTLARSARITAPFASVFTGHVLRILRENHLSEDVVFSKVTCLYLNLYTGTTVPVQELADYQQHIDEFCQFIEVLFPNAQEYHFQVSLFTDTDDNHMVGILLATLISRSSHRLQIAEYVHSSCGVGISGLLNVIGLTHISIQDHASTEECVELVRRNASTLVSVDLGIVDAPEFLPQLITDDSGAPITYPNLRNLAIHMKLLPKNLSASFPVLKHLSCTTGSLQNVNVVSSET
ncbi:hypothetical protein GGI25_002170 [Coemansia spiralis]|uniref:Uncharacterized protein n=2 Tax=Coemansia TaxID=4863 RepID=A0A9W8KZJ8_9FUNG|nr:hypothetical protein BX070DRAFT_221794 [Coemansia spiralis]KAJ1996179.1 hypothetical protein EDC05_000069 [Coemansia umbellata]KAJ2626064.1 hypothetical protein GGI26_000148 [Coemansia sp. RSA 1358]KAJ2678582.1 hypothetical protein GGI25_002170 [Coemansia spiralis]